MSAGPDDLLHALEPPTPADPEPRRVPRPSSPVTAAGHRARLRARLLTAGPGALADHELLEMALFLALPRRDTAPVARALLSRFGGFAACLAAPLPDLRAVEGVGDAGAAALKLLDAAACRLNPAEPGRPPVAGG